jgi:hypothetical protein
MQTLFDQVARLVEQEFYDGAFLDERWPSVKASLAERYRAADNVEAQEAVLGELLQSLGVSHSVLITPALAGYIAEQEANPADLRPQITTYGSTVLARIRSCKVRTTTLADIEVLAIASRACEHLVLDLRVNDGGAGSVVVEIASRFLPPDIPVLRVRDRVGLTLAQPEVVTAFPEEENHDHRLEVEAMRRHHFLEYRTKPVTGVPFRGRLTVVIDRQCYSCGEILAQAFKEHAQARLVGASTAGFVAAAMEHELTDGYGVVLPFAEMRSGRDQLLEGRGVEPHLPLAISDLDDDGLLRTLTALGPDR